MSSLAYLDALFLCLLLCHLLSTPGDYLYPKEKGFVSVAIGFRMGTVFKFG